VYLLSKNNLCRHFLISTRAIAWSLAAAIIVLSIVPPRLRPETALPHDLEHFGIFFAMGIAFSVGYQSKRQSLMVLLVIFSGAVELSQFFVPGRHARVTDFVVDGLAVCTGVVTPILAKQVLAKPKSRREQSDAR
jgi:VanZ family protein